MRKILSGALVALLVVLVVPGRSAAQIPGFDVGLTAGANIATVSGDDVDDADNLTGLMAGLSLIFPTTPMFGIQTEVAYSRKGTKADVDLDGANEEFRVPYIDIPILLKLGLGAWPMQVAPALYFGPYAGINIGCDLETQGVSVDCDDAGLDVKSFDFGLVGGAGVDVGRFNLFARYQYGLADLVEDVDAKNRVLQLGLRVGFQGLR
jgi:hypothetical protein